jgi:DNA invertase Pin-like site-specific DNA recombinase
VRRGYSGLVPGRVLFAFFAAMAETKRENIREATLEGLNAAAHRADISPASEER